jgi:hypothetical protein
MVKVPLEDADTKMPNSLPALTLTWIVAAACV